MNTGLQDAANLGWKLAAVRGGWAPDGLLDTYHGERHPVGRAVLRVRAVRTQVVKHVRPVSRLAIGEITGIGYSYPAPRGAHRLTGKRAPDTELDRGRLYETLRAGKFVLILPRGAGFDVSGRADRLVVAHRLDGQPGTALVRPDGYYAWAADRRGDTGTATEAAVAAWAGAKPDPVLPDPVLPTLQEEADR